ncbi:hypothetical protein VC596_25355, partial [Citrobacter freundii]|uniref:hypothetical protein n=1 Tax=Citrobacter freundii TaxID=546 RepID=UPI00292B60D7
LMMSLWDALRMNMMISYQELVRTFPNYACIMDFSGEKLAFKFFKLDRQNGANETATYAIEGLS